VSPWKGSASLAPTAAHDLCQATAKHKHSVRKESKSQDII
jgi:hypothetical protein